MRKVLEMGHGGTPMGNPLNVSLSDFAKKLPPDTVYFGIDCPQRDYHNGSIRPNRTVRELIEEIEEECREGEPRRIRFLRMDARRTLFKGGVFSEVHLHNIVSDPRVTQADTMAMVAEAHRLLAPGGALVVSFEDSRFIEVPLMNAHLAIMHARLVGLPETDLERLSVFANEVFAVREVAKTVILVAQKA